MPDVAHDCTNDFIATIQQVCQKSTFGLERIDTLDVYPARGPEQADMIYRKVLKPLLDKTRR